MDETSWTRLVQRAKKGRCTPFVGAGACADYLPTAAVLADQCAREHGYPFGNTGDLARVMQYVAIQNGDAVFVKENLIDEVFKNVVAPDFDDPHEPHSLLASLPLSVYLTTNYDDFLVQALKHHRKDPQVVLCPWWTRDTLEIETQRKLFTEPAGYKPEPSRPIVYYLHGHFETPQSLVVTEDDYIEFLVRTAQDPELLPAIIQHVISNRMLLFMGYSLSDWTFWVLFRGLLASRPPSGQFSHVSVQLLPTLDGADAAVREKVQGYLEKYYNNQKITIFWNTAHEFCKQLDARLHAPR